MPLISRQIGGTERQVAEQRERLFAKLNHRLRVGRPAEAAADFGWRPCAPQQIRPTTVQSARRHRSNYKKGPARLSGRAMAVSLYALPACE